MTPLRVVVMGAGAVGCTLGAFLAEEVREVVLIGRAKLCEEVQRCGAITVTDVRGRRRRVPATRLRCTTEPVEMAGADIILVTVKSPATDAIGRLIATYAATASTVVSFQNGVRNADILRQSCGPRPVLRGMVSFNIVRQADAAFHIATSGPVVVERSQGPARWLVPAWRSAGLDAQQHDAMEGVQWSKLLFNLNNALAALSDLPLREELRDRGYRRLLAAAMREGLDVMRAAGIKPVRLGKMMPRVASRLLGLPDVVFKRLARTMVTIDPRARSSMWDDLTRGRPTEIRQLQGEVVDRGRQLGVPTPVCRAITQLIEEAEAAGSGPPGLSAQAIEERVASLQ